MAISINTNIISMSKKYKYKYNFKIIKIKYTKNLRSCIHTKRKGKNCSYFLECNLRTIYPPSSQDRNRRSPHLLLPLCDVAVRSIRRR